MPTVGVAIGAMRVEVNDKRDAVVFEVQINGEVASLEIPPDQAVVLGGHFIAKAGACYAQPDPGNMKKCAPAAEPKRSFWEMALARFLPK
jgi:hypothetical protein